jgi:ubiquinone/menaquinone biosynthesis C-methylase UbiE
MFDVQRYFQDKLVDLGTIEGRFSGILIPTAEIGAAKTGITDQFLSGAEAYHDRYADSEHWLRLFNRAFAEVTRPAAAGLEILDIGAGSGVNTVVPCLRLFPGCRIVATDFSAPLLRILRSYLFESGLNDRVACVCTDAMRTQFRPASFDVVVGGSILHHLVQPELALAAAYRALKRGGLALFFEPFEGYAVLRVAFELILARARRDSLPLPDALAAMMTAMIRDFAMRAGTDKSAPVFRDVDDKWLFTRTYLERVTRDIGFSAMTLVPTEKPRRQFRLAAEGLVKVGAGLKAHDLPDWAWEYIDKFDQTFSEEMKREIPLECAIALQK